MVRPGSLMRVLLVLLLIASGVTYAQNQVKPNQLLVFISAIDPSGAPLTDLKTRGANVSMIVHDKANGSVSPGRF